MKYYLFTFIQFQDPPSNALYNGQAFGNGDGFVPFYLTQCRGTNVPKPLSDNDIINEMHSALFRVKVELDTKPSPVNSFAFILSGNNIPSFYQAILNKGDYWSLGVDLKLLNVQRLLVYNSNINHYSIN